MSLCNLNLDLDEHAYQYRFTPEWSDTRQSRIQLTFPKYSLSSKFKTNDKVGLDKSLPENRNRNCFWDCSGYLKKSKVAKLAFFLEFFELEFEILSVSRNSVFWSGVPTRDTLNLSLSKLGQRRVIKNRNSCCRNSKEVQSLTMKIFFLCTCLRKNLEENL